ncbi:fibrinogen C domain-containing protein 1-like isoform X2 [Corythoichthys intestinalis]|uniref:fibrinogen C domain-containing protein 1-like isoform X2 n=1 Tax=Corythoichthys intestinalis TaxID=161448 RepID=UPI0025A597AF|nr:fibrinogen C domain-containing protein 1-like isoform X2 [Corythoichthys intestinalis]
MMLNDSWTAMNNSSSELGGKTRNTRKKCCSFLLWAVLVVAVVAVVTATVVILYVNNYPLPFVNRASRTSPVISTNPKESGALVTVSQAGEGDGISIFLDPNCPDPTFHLERWEALQSSLARALSSHNSEDRQEMAHVRALTEDAAAGHLRRETHALKNGQAVLEQRLEHLKNQQNRIAQVLSDEHAVVLKLSSALTDSLSGLRRDTESLGRLHLDKRKGRAIAEANNVSNSDRRRPTVYGIPPAPVPRDCSEVLSGGNSRDGVYSIFPVHEPAGFMVYCDMSTDAGGWTVIQRRQDGSVNFFRGWEAYRDGFGKTTGEHWLGLQRIYALTRSGGYELRIDMADFENATAFANYAEFSVGRDSVNPEEDGYPLDVDRYSGTAGDSLLKHSGMAFTTKDRDLDQSENNCATYYQGAWWYRNCHTSNLNGRYLGGAHASYADGVEWSSWTGWQYSLRFTEMKIRPRPKAT